MLSDQNKIRPVLIFSAEDEHKTKQTNSQSTQRLQRLLDNMRIPYKKVIGSYKGQLEYSFITHAQYLPDLRYVIYGLFEQESILYIDKQNDCKLIFDDKADVKLGKLQKIAV